MAVIKNQYRGRSRQRTPNQTPRQSSVRTPSRAPSRPRSRASTVYRNSLSRSTASTRRSSTASMVGVLQSLMTRPKAQINVTKQGSTFKTFKKTKQLKTRKFDVLGATNKVEVAGSKASNECIYLGHCTLPQKYFWKTFFTAILKKLFAQVGNLPHQLEEALPYVIGTDVVTLFYKNDPNAAATAITYTFTAASNKLEFMADLFAGAFSGAIGTNTQLQEIRFVPTDGSKLKFQRLNLMSAKMAVKATSVMKIQNVSLGLGGSTDAENVGSMALSGRYYKGYGTGTQYIADQQVSQNFYADELGLINPNTAAVKDLSEPPPGYVFTSVKTEGGISMDPGEIKTSVLKENFTIGLNTVVRRMLVNPDSLTPVLKGGSFAFLAFEKSVDDLAGGEQGVKVQYDVQCNIHMYMIGGTNTISIPCVTQVNL